MWILGWMAATCAGVCGVMSFNFYRKYRLRLHFGATTGQYSRIADYTGIPLPLAFEYRSEEGGRWFPVEVDVEEIYHYGSEYFMRGSDAVARKGNIFKWNRVAKLRFRSSGRSLDSVEALLGEAAGQVSGSETGWTRRGMHSSVTA